MKQPIMRTTKTKCSCITHQSLLVQKQRTKHGAILFSPDFALSTFYLHRYIKDQVKNFARWSWCSHGIRDCCSRSRTLKAAEPKGVSSSTRFRIWLLLRNFLKSPHINNLEGVYWCFNIHADWKWRRQWVREDLLCSLDITFHRTTPCRTVCGSECLGLLPR